MLYLSRVSRARRWQELTVKYKVRIARQPILRQWDNLRGNLRRARSRIITVSFDRLGG